MRQTSPTWTKDKLAPLARDFYTRSTLDVARDLLGKRLVKRSGCELLVGSIVETEAYIGEDDPACHARFGRTDRNRVMYGVGGVSYVYFVYGMYNMLNVVTEDEGFPAAVLIRAVEPIIGIEVMKKSRGMSSLHNLTNGPGKLCMAYNVDTSDSGVDLTGAEMFISDGEAIKFKIGSSGRIGIKEGTEQQWRFFVEGNRFVSR